MATKAEALQNNVKLNALLEDFQNITKEVLVDVADLLDTEDHNGYITNTSTEDLYNDETLLMRVADKAGYPLYNDDGSLYVSPNDGTTSKYLYIYMIYIYKFGSNEPFWDEKVFSLLPRYDFAEVSENERLRLLFQSIGIKFDQLEELISDMAELPNIDEVPDEYLAYLAQLLGYEKEDFQLGDTSFRELVKNVIEIYKIKGTNYSFTFFFKFLGFDYEVYEVYFDRDRDNPGEADDSAGNYLTRIDPRERFETDPLTGDIVLAPIPPEDFTETRNTDMFDILADPARRNIPVNILLGKMGDFPSPWTYFKTNVIQHDLTQFFQGDTELVPNDPDIVDRIINKYIKFLSPSYIQSSININLTPYQDGPIPVYEQFTVELLKKIYDVIGVNSTGSEWEQLKSDYDTVDTEEDEQVIEVYDTVFQEVSIDTQGYPFNEDPDRVGDYIRHNGIHARGPEHPSHITGLQHTLTFRTAFENVIAYVDHINWDFTLTGDQFIEWLRTNPYPTV